ncbi:hypothetical protein TNCV_2597551 [Trichonephila clavipes]|nr:hypothetical protein TNCV_2597551 [Trichonephila clavipes]
MLAYDFRNQKAYRLQPGSNPQPWVYEAHATSKSPSRLSNQRFLVIHDIKRDKDTHCHPINILVSEGVRFIFTSPYKAAQGLFVTDLVILINGQVTRTTPELAPPPLTFTPPQREDFELDKFNVHQPLYGESSVAPGFEPATSLLEGGKGLTATVNHCSLTGRAFNILKVKYALDQTSVQHYTFYRCVEIQPGH